MSQISNETQKAPPADMKVLRKTISGAAVGNIVEQYDFAIFGSMSALVFARLFFPGNDPTAALLASFSTFAVGFFARPLGALVAGHYGDRIGRKPVLVVMLLMAGISTALIGVLPTHAQVGTWAAVLLVALRFVQGVSFGGEYGGAVLIVNESAPTAKRGFYTGFIPASSAVGVIFANIVVLSVAFLPNEQFLSWGWRVPFLLSLVMVIIGLFIRSRVPESAAYTKAEAKAEATGEVVKSKRPLIRMLLESPKELLLTIGITMGIGAVNYLVLVWVLSYLADPLKLPREVGLTALIVGEVFYAASALGSSALSDKIGRRKTIVIGAALFTVFAFPFFAIINTGNPVLIVIAVTAALTFVGAAYGPLASLMSELFATKHRYSGASSGFQIGQTLGGGLSPLIATSLFAATGSIWAIAIYMLIGGVICMISAFMVTETANAELIES